MKMNEIAGTGNWNTAEFWEYGTREAQRKNPDPVKNPSMSPYAVFNGNPIAFSDVKGDDPRIVAWVKNILNNGEGIKQLSKGNWGYKKTERTEVRGEAGYAVVYHDGHYRRQTGESFRYTNPNSTDDAPSLKDKLFDWLNNTWMNYHDPGAQDEHSNNRGSSVHNAGVVWTDPNGQGMETTTAKEVLFMGPWALPGSNAGGSPGVSNGRYNFSDLANSIQAFADFAKDIKDYRSGEKPLIEKRGPSLRPESKIDTTWDYFRNLWHTRAKYGDTLPVDSDPYNPNPNFKSNK